MSRLWPSQVIGALHNGKLPESQSSSSSPLALDTGAPAGHGAFQLSGRIAKKYPEEYETWYYVCKSSNEYYGFLKEKFDPVPFPPHLKGHETTPFVWFENNTEANTNDVTPIGGGSHLREYVMKQEKFTKVPEIVEWATLGIGGVFGTEITEMWIGYDPMTASTV